MQIKSRTLKTAQKLSRRVNRREVFVYIVFMLCTTIVWFVQATERRQEDTLHCPIIYDNLSKQYAFAGSLPQRLDVKVSAKGSELLSLKDRDDLPAIHIDAGEQITGNRMVVSCDELQALVGAVLPAKYRLEATMPENIDLEWQQLSSRTVAISANVVITPAPQHIITGEASIMPLEATIYGTRDALDSIGSITTERFVADKLDRTLHQELRLVLPDNVKCDLETVTLTAAAEPFTEKRFKAKIIIINRPAGANINLFPDQVDVCANVLQKDFGNADQQEVKVIFDYAKSGSGQLVPLEVEYSGTALFNIRITPGSADYLVELN